MPGNQGGLSPDGDGVGERTWSLEAILASRRHQSLGAHSCLCVYSVQGKFLFIELFWHEVIAVTDGSSLYHRVYKDFTSQMRVVRELRELPQFLISQRDANFKKLT
jgi:hypothetical protein